ncbi:hypothetical protein MNB_SV-15-468 [hydrothermal vent metagenome]|uniref:DUF234 domain-containing protein n=1 Tax=hydrothermal vent metagenome TaxID=652676 RepID=A0A1W1EIX8_9ZZZZ
MYYFIEFRYNYYKFYLKGSIIISTNQTLSEQFKAFCIRNNPRTKEEAIEYFAIFGGLDIKVNTTVDINILIEKLILNKYKYLRNDISYLIKGDNQYYSILSALALGDRRTNSAFRRVNIEFDDGIEIVDDLCGLKVLKLEKSLKEFSHLNNKYIVSEKLIFKSPFVRFWFAFISPIFKGIRDGEYEEFYKIFNNRKSEFIAFIFEELSHELLKISFDNDRITKIGRYWDDDREIGILAKTKSGKVIAGVSKYTNSKIKKSELTKLKNICEDAKINVDIFVIFAKKGYSTELKSLKGRDLKLFTARNFNF